MIQPEWVSQISQIVHINITHSYTFFGGKKKIINWARSLLPCMTFSANQLKLIYMPIFLMIKEIEKTFLWAFTLTLKKKLLLYYNLESLHFIFRIWHWSLSYDTTKHSDNCHPKLKRSSVRTWQLHSSEPLRFFLMLITLFPSSYYTDTLDQKGSQESFSSKNLVLLLLAFTCMKTVLVLSAYLKDHQLLIRRFTSFSYLVNACSRAFPLFDKFCILLSDRNSPAILYKYASPSQ